MTSPTHSDPPFRRLVVHHRSASDSVFNYPSPRRRSSSTRRQADSKTQDVVQQVAKEPPNPASKLLFKRIQRLIQEEKSQQAWDLWDKNKEDTHVQPKTTKQYYHLLNLFVKAEKQREASELWQQMQKGHKQPRTILQYHILINFFIQTNQVEEALKLWESMQTKPIEQYVVISHKLLDFAAASPQKPPFLARIAFNQVALFIQQHKLAEALSLWEGMQTKSIEPDDVEHYNILFVLFVKKEKLQDILTFWSQMQEKQIQPNQGTFHILSSFFIHSKQVKEEAFWYGISEEDRQIALGLLAILEKGS